MGKKRPRWRRLGISLSLLFLGSPASRARAGVLFSSSLGWGIFAFRPQAEETSPNYYGVGPEALFGFSFRQTFDMAAFVTYTPGSIGAPHLGSEQASLVLYGGELSMRLQEEIFMGLRGGLSRYQLVKPLSHPNEVRGLWSGPCGGMSLGAIHQVDKRNYWQLTFDFMHAVLAREGGPDRLGGEALAVKRRLDSFRISVTYTFNGFVNHAVQDSLFKNVF